MKAVKNSMPMVLISLILFSSVAFGEQGTERRPAKEKWDNIKIEALVQQVDQENRMVVLMGPEGNLITLSVDERVKRFNEIKAGDKISAEYWSYIMAEFRDPTPEESETPFMVLSESAKAPEGTDPGAVVGAIVRAVVTVEIINHPFMAVTVKGPRGHYLTLPVSDANLIKELHIGEVVVMTYSEAVALSLEKTD